MKLTREQAIENHRKMWNWIADETLRWKRVVMKEKYFVANNIPDSIRPVCDCYCCEYGAINFRRNCSVCPIQWKHRLCYVSEYDNWRKACYAENYKKAANLARTIANLPENEHIADVSKKEREKE